MRAAPIMIVAVAWLLGGAAGTDLDLAGELMQGGLVRGRVPPDTTVWLDGRSLRVTPDGWFVFGFGRDAPASAELLIRRPNGEERRHILQIAPRTYRVQRIDGLPPHEVTPSEADLAKIHADAALLDRSLGSPLSPEDVERLRAVIDASGAHAQVEAVIDQLTDVALAALDRATIDDGARAVLRGLSSAVTHRSV